MCTKKWAIMWKNKESYVDEGGVFGLSIIKHVTLQKIVAHDFRYAPRVCVCVCVCIVCVGITPQLKWHSSV